MKYKTIYKVEKGKMLRLSFDVEENKIKEIEIRGDFFLYPEEELENMEKFLIGKNIQEIGNELSDFQEDRQIKFFGFSPRDIQEAINNAMETNN